MSRIKLIALDLDGTALRSDNTLSPAVARSVEKAAGLGIEIVAASGRPYHSMPKAFLELNGVNYVISSNGAAIYDNSGRRIRETLMPEAEVLKLLEITKNEDLIWEAFLNGGTYTDIRYLADPLKYGCTPAYIEYVRGSRAGLDDMRKYIYDNRQRLDSVEFVCTDSSLRGRVRADIERECGGLYVTSSSANFVEMMHASATKSNALKWLCKLKNIPLESTAACGNADNDADMIACAGLSAAVDNASKSCKDAADIIVPSNDLDGVAALIDIILREPPSGQ